MHKYKKYANKTLHKKKVAIIKNIHKMHADAIGGSI